MRIEGRTWVFAEDNVNTDLMMPAATFRMPRAEQAKHVFATYRPGWAASIERGDILIGGRNFGTGSSRPAPSLMADLGIVAVVAESLNGLFFRNCVNSGVGAVECPGIVGAVTEPDTVAIDLASGTVTNRRTGVSLAGSALPDELIAIITDGGLLPRLQRGGYVRVGHG
jgi:3-isopropylmalate/(R)-2-methylmalate dehydratase small subunit